MLDALLPFYLWFKAIHVTFVVAYFAGLVTTRRMPNRMAMPAARWVMP